MFQDYGAKIIKKTIAKNGSGDGKKGYGLRRMVYGKGLDQPIVNNSEKIGAF